MLPTAETAATGVGNGLPESLEKSSWDCLGGQVVVGNGVKVTSKAPHLAGFFDDLLLVIRQGGSRSLIAFAMILALDS